MESEADTPVTKLSCCQLSVSLVGVAGREGVYSNLPPLSSMMVVVTDLIPQRREVSACLAL